MRDLAYILVGLAWAAMAADAALTLHGLASGKLVEKTRLMRWFVKSPWRLWPVVALQCALVWGAAHVLVVWVAPWAGAAATLPVLVRRVLVCVKNYRLNVAAW